ncbi:MAG: HAD family hydrolase [Bacillota bacterium]|nr:HAD family hydrolase [Bacillota bacterium]
MYPKAILFDLDDTLISFDGVTEAAWEETCCSFVDKMQTPYSSKTLLEVIGRVRKWYWSDPERHRTGRLNILEARREIVKQAMENLQYFDEGAAFELADNYSRRQREMIHLLPDTVCTLERLKNLGIRMALITNGTSKEQRGKLTRFSLENYFEVCLIEEEVGYGKPDPRVFELALGKLGLKAHEAWMVGDNLLWDVEAPQKVGIFSIWNDYRKKGLPEKSLIKPDRIINTVCQLI